MDKISESGFAIVAIAAFAFVTIPIPAGHGIVPIGLIVLFGGVDVIAHYTEWRHAHLSVGSVCMYLGWFPFCFVAVAPWLKTGRRRTVFIATGMIISLISWGGFISMIGAGDLIVGFVSSIPFLSMVAVWGALYGRSMFVTTNKANPKGPAKAKPTGSHLYF
jgi:hypothetical protein